MKNKNLFKILCICTLIMISSITAFAQKVSFDDSVLPENRPFDFRDKYYDENGVEPSLIFLRCDGTDKFSVLDTINDGIHRGVRMIGTMPAYNFDGKMLYWNQYGELFDLSFKNDTTGKDANLIANSFPIYIFPSTTVRNSNRQAHLIAAYEGYFQKNTLGLGVEVIVIYTDIPNIDNEPMLAKLAETNGISLDGTPIIRTTQELEDLTRRGIVTQRIKGSGDISVPSYAIGPVIYDPRMGGISPDSYLMMVLQKNGKPLDAEAYFVDNFDCLQKTGSFCRPAK
jgi:hypothetical protein